MSPIYPYTLCLKKRPTFGLL